MQRRDDANSCGKRGIDGGGVIAYFIKEEQLRIHVAKKTTQRAVLVHAGDDVDTRPKIEPFTAG